MADVQHLSIVVDQTAKDANCLEEVEENSHEGSDSHGSFVDITELENGDLFSSMHDDDDDLKGQEESSVSESHGDAVTIASRNTSSGAGSTKTLVQVPSRRVEANVSDLTWSSGSEAASSAFHRNRKTQDQKICVAAAFAPAEEARGRRELLQRSNSKLRSFMLRRRSCESLDSVPEDREAVPRRELLDSRSSLSTMSTWSSFRGSFRRGKKKPKNQTGTAGTKKRTSPIPSFVQRVLNPGKDTRWDLEENESGSLQTRSTAPPSRPTRPPSSPTKSQKRQTSFEELSPTKLGLIPSVSHDSDESGLTCDTSSLRREDLEQALESAGITWEMVEILKQSGFQITECT